MQPAISTSALTRRFGDHVAVDELTLEVGTGEILGLLGPNGAGKTTTVRLLNGILTPDAGTVRVLGLDPVAQGDELRRRTGVLTEGSGLDDRLTARENVLAHARIRKLDPGAAARRADELLERFGVADRSRDRVRGFSTGQRKRVALARSLVHDPDVLFLDEPTSGLDPEATRDVLELIRSLAHDLQRTVVLCTHFLSEAGSLCSRLAVLRRGRLVAHGTLAELADQLAAGAVVDVDLGGPAPPWVVEMLGDVAGVVHASAGPTGATVEMDGREATPGVVARLAAAGVAVFSVVPRSASVEDVYFAATTEPADSP